MARKKRGTWRCTKCGSDQVEIKVWYDPNDQKLGELAELEIAECWCANCQEHNLVYCEGYADPCYAILDQQNIAT